MNLDLNEPFEDWPRFVRGIRVFAVFSVAGRCGGPHSETGYVATQAPAEALLKELDA